MVDRDCQSRSPGLDGWRNQADGLARKHTAIPALPRTATAQPPRRQPAGDNRSSDQRAEEVHREQAVKTSGKDFSREQALDWILNARKEALAVRADRAKAAEARIADLEASLEAALARVVYLENENQSLQTSVELTTSENLSFARRLAESETRSDEASAELHNSALLWAEHDRVVSAAERKIDLLQNLLAVKEARLHKLEQARDKMEQDTDKLLETAKTRDKALADAEQRIFILTELFEKLELSLDAGKGENDNQAPDPKPGANEPTDMPEAGREVRVWRRELDTDDWLLAKPAKA